MARDYDLLYSGVSTVNASSGKQGTVLQVREVKLVTNTIFLSHQTLRVTVILGSNPFSNLLVIKMLSVVSLKLY